MSNADQVRLSLGIEPSFGGSPLSPTTLQDLRITGESLGFQIASTESKELRYDRQNSDIIRTSISAAGGISGELSYGAWDELIRGIQFSAGWSAPVTVGPIATISAASADNSFNDSGNGFGAILPNQWIRAKGFTTAANNGLFKVITATAGKLVVKGGTLVNEAAAAGRSIIMGAQVLNGVAMTSYYLEREFTDVVLFNGFTGMVPSTWNVDVGADSIITTSFDFLGKQQTAPSVTVGSAYVTAPTNEVMAGVDDVFAVNEGKRAAMTQLTDVNKFSFTVNNNLRSRLRVGTLGAFSLGAGKIAVSGSLLTYFSSNAMITKFLNFTESALAFPLYDADGNGYVFDFPAVKFTRGQTVAGGTNSDVMADMTWMAKLDATEGITMRVARFPGP